MYKWVDENGQTHYSQTPPEGLSPSTGTSEEVTVRSRLPSHSPVRRDGRWYCGELRLPERDADVGSYLVNLKIHREAWVENRDRAREDHRSLLREAPDDDARPAIKRTHEGRLDSAREQLARYQCAIVWADAEIRNYADYRQSLVSEYESARAELDELRTRRANECAVDKSILVGEEAREYQSCVDQYDARIRELNGVVRRNRRQMELLMDPP
jgi:hypothetical protein